MTYPACLDFKDIQADDIVFVSIPYGSEFVFPAPFNLLESGVGWFRYTGGPIDLYGFPVGTTFTFARGVGVVK